jgi:hypothetical protein
MVETEADKHVGLPRQVFTDPYPALPKLAAATITRAIRLREEAEDEDKASASALDEIFAQAAMLARFADAERAYGSPLVIQRTAEARTALLVGCGESFVGVLMPIRPEVEQIAQHRSWQAAWLRRLPTPDPEAVSMPAVPAKPRQGADPDGDAEDTDPSLYVPQPEDEPELFRSEDEPALQDA